MKKRNLLLFAAFAVFLSMSNLQAQQYILTDNDVVVENGIVQSCSYNFEFTDIIIPNILDGQAVTEIKDASWTGEGIFQEKGITSVQLPVSIEYIGKRAFKNNQITILDLSSCSNIKIIGNESFELNSIEEVYLNNCNVLISINEYAFVENAIKNLDFSSCTSLVSIGRFAFRYNEVLDTLNFQNCESLKIIDTEAFSLNNIKSLDLSPCINLKEIGYLSFYSNTNMHSLDLSGCTNLWRIHDWAFDFTALSSVDLSYCTSLVWLDWGVFDDTPNLDHIILPTPNFPGFEYWEDFFGNVFNAGDTVSKVNPYYAQGVFTPITFIVTSDGSPIDSARIDFYNGPYITNEYGMLALANVLQGSYPYTVSAEGFVDVKGEVLVDVDSLSLTIEMSGLAVNEFHESELSVYPNPGKNRINFELPKNFTDGRVELYNNNGRLIVGKYIQGNFKSISTENLPQGIYLYRVFNDDKVVYSGKWVKE